MAGACGLQMDGPLAPLAAGFEESLAAVGYSQERVRQLMDLLAEVSHWLGAGGLCANDLTGEVVDEFFAERKTSRSRCRTARSFQPVIVHLRSIGVAAAPPSPAVGRTDTEVELLDCYRRWCVAQRGLTCTTTDQYVRRVAVFLALWRPDARVVVADLDGGAILATIRGGRGCDAEPVAALHGDSAALLPTVPSRHRQGYHLTRGCGPSAQDVAAHSPAVRAASR